VKDREKGEECERERKGREGDKVGWRRGGGERAGVGWVAMPG